jgi:hypothetical protein
VPACLIPRCLSVLGLSLLSACASSGLVTAFPTSLDFGTVDFIDDVPDGGFAPTELTVRNGGESDLAILLTDIDFERLCVAGFAASPIDIGTLSPGSSYVLTVGVCGYDREGGERDTLVSGSFNIDAEGAETVAVPWSFTPTLGLGEDSG